MNFFLKQFFLLLAVISFQLHSDENLESTNAYPVVVLGGGMGAMTASIYLARADLHPIVIEGPLPGGLLTQSHSVQNWPGEVSIDGQALAQKIRQQAILAGANFLSEEVIEVDFSQKPYKILVSSSKKGEKQTLYANAIIIAMGSTPNRLHVAGESEYWGRGVTSCAICDGNLFKGKEVAVVGGGDSAVLEASYLSNIASHVTVLVRKDKFRAKEKKRLDLLLKKKNVSVLYDTEITSILGNGSSLESLEISTSGNKKTIPMSGVFLAIGSKPNSSIFKNQLKLDANGYVVLKKGQQTSKEGIYAAGDVTDDQYMQAITAAGDGAKAALEAQNYLLQLQTESVKKSSLKVGSLNAENAQVLKPLEITSMAQFQREISESQVPILIDFYAAWCGPCKKIAPKVDATCQRLQGKVKVLKVNASSMQKLSEKYQIQSIPTLILLDPSGKILDRASGYDGALNLMDNLSY